MPTQRELIEKAVMMLVERKMRDVSKRNKHIVWYEEILRKHPRHRRHFRGRWVW